MPTDRKLGSCLSIWANRCLGITLFITNDCDATIVYDADGRYVELVNSTRHRHEATTENMEHQMYVNVPDGYGLWTRELFYKFNPEQKIKVTVLNMPPYSYCLTIIAILGAIVALALYFCKKWSLVNKAKELLSRNKNAE